MPTVVSSKNYSSQTTDLQLTAPVTEDHGTRHYILCAGKPLFLGFSGVHAKVCVDKRKPEKKPLLVIDPQLDQNQELITVLNDLRSRFIQQLQIS